MLDATFDTEFQSKGRSTTGSLSHQLPASSTVMGWKFSVIKEGREKEQGMKRSKVEVQITLEHQLADPAKAPRPLRAGAWSPKRHAMRREADAVDLRSLLGLRPECVLPIVRR